MTPVELVLSKLPGAKLVGNAWQARCPAHKDRKPSLTVSEGDDGRALVRCHAGCSFEAIVSAIGLIASDLMPARDTPTPRRNRKPKPNTPTFPTANEAVMELERQHGKRSASWTYSDADGEPVGLVVRWDRPTGKDIRPVSIHADGWRIGAMPEPRPLYGLPELATANRVVVVEGEKAVDAARSIGFVATTSAGGSQAASKADWQPLAGKEVWILPDNDAPGRKYADTVAGILITLNPPATVKIIALPGIPDAGDIVDWIDAHGDAAEPRGMRMELEALVGTAKCIDNEPTAGNVDSFVPFPVDALPEPIRGLVASGALAIGCDPSFIALPQLVALASAIGNTRRLELKRGWSVPPILWGAIVGESGTAKTPAFKLVMKPIEERQQRAFKRHAEAMTHHEAELTRWEKELATWKRDKHATGEPPAKPEPPPAERFSVADTTVEALAPILSANPRGVLLSRDELAGWIGSFDRYAGKGKASGDSSNWLSMYNAGSVTVDRKTGTPRTIHVPHAAICIVGGIQPGILQRALGAEHRESGLLARLLLAYPPRRAKHWTDADIDPTAEAELARLFDRLYGLQPTYIVDGEPRPVVVRLSADAKPLWVDYANTNGAEQVELTGDLSAAWSKLEEYAARFALVIHFVRYAAHDPTLTNAETVDAESMTAGIRLATWFKNESRRVYGMLSESETDRDQRRLAEWIERQRGSVTAREAQQGCRWLKEPGTAEAALEELVKAGKGRWESTPSGQRGQPTRRFTVNAVYGNSNSKLESAIS